MKPTRLQRIQNLYSNGGFKIIALFFIGYQFLFDHFSLVQLKGNRAVIDLVLQR